MYTLKFTTEDSGPQNCKERTRFEAYISSLWNIGSKVATNLKIYEYLCNNKSKSLRIVSHIFFQITKINSYFQCIMALSEIYKKENNDSVNLQTFYNYAEQNQRFLFNKKFFEEKFGRKGSKKEIEMKTFAELKENYMQAIQSKETLIKKLIKERNKIVAHFDKKYYLRNKNIKMVNIHDLYELLDTFSTLFNNLCIKYDRVLRTFEPILADDIKQSVTAIDFFLKHKKEYCLKNTKDNF